MVGNIISHYKILDKIGEGGAGIVYKAEDISLNRTVALKFLPRGTVESIERKKLFIREAQAAASLDHPNICTIHGIEEVGDQLFIVMAYIEGDTLQKVIDKQTFKIEDVVSIGLQMAEGLKEAHSKGLVHGDLKSTNIMITPKGRVKIMDFGLAKPVGESASTGPSTSHDSILYMSPEQVRKERIDKRSDVWSFGIILYQMLTRKLPFKSSKEQAVLYSILSYNPTPIEKYRGNVPTEIADIIQKTLAKDPDQRYPDAGALLKELKHLEGKTFDEIAALPFAAGTAEPVPKKKKKNLLVFAALGVIVTVLLLFLIFGGKGAGLKPGEKLKLAVLPFDNLDKKKDIDYFCYGMTDEIINKLSRLQQLTVITRSSVTVRLYNYAETDPKKIGERLKVDYIIKGGVSQIGKNLDIKSSLYRTEDGEELWMGEFNRKITDIFSIQGELAQQIAVTLKTKLPVDEIEFLKKQPTTNINAYNLYLLGRFYAEKRSAESLPKAIEYYQQAIKLDSKFALAYTGIADTYILLTSRALVARQEAYPNAKNAALKALKLDSELAEAHTSLGMIKFAYEGDNEGAQKELKRAISLNPGYAIAHQWYSFVLFFSNADPDYILTEGTKALEQALELNPYSLVLVTNLASAKMLAYEWKKAEELLKLAKEIDEKSPVYTHNILDFLVTTNRMSEAEKEISRLIAQIQKDPSNMDYHLIASIYLFYLRRYDESIKLLNEKIAKQPGIFDSHYWLGYNLIMKGKYKEALTQIEKAKAIFTNFNEGIELLLAVTHNRLGDTSLINNIIRDEDSSGRKQKFSSFAKATIYSELGDIDKVFFFLEESAAKHETGIISLRYNPLFDKYKTDYRFKKVLIKIGLL